MLIAYRADPFDELHLVLLHEKSNCYSKLFLVGIALLDFDIGSCTFTLALIAVEESVSIPISCLLSTRLLSRYLAWHSL